MIQLPLVHINGTSRQGLIEPLSEACDAVTKAIEKVEAAAPNQRDYYPLGDAAWAMARDQHAARLDALSGVLRDLCAIVFGIEDQP